VKDQEGALIRLHPGAIKHLKNGHPWITQDCFTQKYPKNAAILNAKINGQFFIFLHDPDHPHIKARLWKKTDAGNEVSLNFEKELEYKLHQAFSKRSPNLFVQRQNIYLAFGENDEIPGLHILFLAGTILLQDYTTGLWAQRRELLVRLIPKVFKQVFENIPEEKPSYQAMLYQQRHKGENQGRPFIAWDGDLSHQLLSGTPLQVQEFGLIYQLRFDAGHDFGLYCDMSAIRHILINSFKNVLSFLNLFSYTGAFTLFAFSQGAREGCSIDLSPKYMDWLELNLKNNQQQFQNVQHTSIIKPVSEGLKKIKQEMRKFDLIICDPPTFSSDGDKRKNHFGAASELLVKMYELLNPKGKIILFNNTHKIGRQKFEQLVREEIRQQNLRLKLERSLSLNQDCPRLKGFPEGDYLKGVILVKDRDSNSSSVSPAFKISS